MKLEKENKKIQLLKYFGDDDNHVDVARVSYGKECSNYNENQNKKLIKYLVSHGHTSPFRHSNLQFRIKCPIYVERQLFKHQVGISVNSISGRYVDFSDSYFKIKNGEWREQSTSSKQGSGELCQKHIQDKANIIQDAVIDLCKSSYEELIKNGVSKEQARTILPLNLETEFIWTGSFLSFVHLCNLRLKEDTQRETRDVVREMLSQIRSIEGNPFKNSLEAFNLL